MADPEELDQEELEGLGEMEWSGSADEDFEDMDDDEGAEAEEDAWEVRREADDETDERTHRWADACWAAAAGRPGGRAAQRLPRAAGAAVARAAALTS